MKFLRKILLVGLLPGFLISQAQNVQNKEDVPLDLGYRVLPMGDYNGSAYTISGKQLRNLPVTIFRQYWPDWYLVILLDKCKVVD